VFCAVPVMVRLVLPVAGMMKYACCSALLVVILSACSGDIANDDEEAVAEDEAVDKAEDAILQALTSVSFAGTVRLDILSGDALETWCTATVLTEHWLLTAAHCVDDVPAAASAMVLASFAGDGVPGDTPAETVYSGPIEIFVHPS
jgi:secreted trypsin-like serine protease